MTAILDEWDSRSGYPPQFLAYMLATTYHETARTMQPIAEYGGAHTRYAPYYGRGFVQLTWQANYQKAGNTIGVDLVGHPERALELPIATTILFDGMLDGWFTSKKLSDYISASHSDFVGARAIINGTDRAQLIAGYADQFDSAILAAMASPAAQHATPYPVPLPPTPVGAKTSTAKKAAGAGVAAAATAIAVHQGFVNMSVVVPVLIVIAIGAAVFFLRAKITATGKTAASAAVSQSPASPAAATAKPDTTATNTGAKS